MTFIVFYLLNYLNAGLSCGVKFLVCSLLQFVKKNSVIEYKYIMLISFIYNLMDGWCLYLIIISNRLLIEFYCLHVLCFIFIHFYSFMDPHLSMLFSYSCKLFECTFWKATDLCYTVKEDTSRHSIQMFCIVHTHLWNICRKSFEKCCFHHLQFCNRKLRRRVNMLTRNKQY